MKIFLFLFFFLWLELTQAQDFKERFDEAWRSRNIYKIIEVSRLWGDDLMGEGDYVAAEECYVRACLYTDTLLGQTSRIRIPKIKNAFSLFINSYEKLAQLYMVSGNTKKAEEAFSVAIKKRESFYPRLSIHRIPPYLGLGKLFFSQGDVESAYLYFEMARKKLERATTSVVNFDVLASEIYQFQFETALLKGKFKEAWKRLDQFLIALNTTNPSSERIAQALELKARYYLFTGAYPNCEFYLDKASNQQYSTTVFSRAQINILKTKAQLLWRKNDIHGASNAFKDLMGTYKKNIEKSFSSMSEYEREQFFITLKNDFELFNAFVLENFSTEAGGLLLEELFNIQLYTKALLLNEINKTKARAVASGDNELKSMLMVLRKLKDELSALYYKGDKNDLAGSLEQKISDLERQINSRSRLFQDVTQEIDWRKVQSKLKEDQAAVEIIRARKFGSKPLPGNIGKRIYYFTDSVFYLVLIITNEAIRPEGFILRGGSDLESRYLNYYRNTIKEKLQDTLSYRMFWKPIQERLANYNKVFLSADGVFNQINLNSLYNPESQKYVLDETDLVLVTNTKDLLIPERSPLSKYASLYGRPAYSYEKQSEQITAVNTGTDGKRSLFDRDLKEFTTQDFSDLPGTQNEINNVSEILKSYGWKVNSYLGIEASETNLKSINSPAVLHIATHGFFLAGGNQSANSMIRSGIVLSGIKNKDDQSFEDGVLTAYEATNLNLEQTQLVVLSACETGLGEVRNGEGVYGLQRGFKVAGAHNLLMSLWKIDDYATAFLMTEFYNAWSENADIHAAFRKAQQLLRNKYDHPYYWASFILLGN